MLTTLAPALDSEILAASQELMKTIVLGLIGLVGTAATIGIGLLSRKILAWLSAKADQAQSDAKSAESNAHLQAFACLTQKLEGLSTKAVAEVEQTLVRQLKRDNQWNIETARGARDAAVEIMKRHAGEQGMAEIQQCSGLTLSTIEGMFRTWVESKVADTNATPTGLAKPTGLSPSAHPPIVPMNVVTGAGPASTG